jgi:hypothetical protein
LSERKPFRAIDLLRAAGKKGYSDADWLLAKLEAKLQFHSFCDDRALRSCFEDDLCGRTLSMYVWFSGPQKNLVMLRQAAESGDAFGQFMLAVVVLKLEGDKKEAAKWMQLAVDQGFPDAIGHFVKSIGMEIVQICSFVGERLVSRIDGRECRRFSGENRMACEVGDSPKIYEPSTSRLVY